MELTKSLDNERVGNFNKILDSLTLVRHIGRVTDVIGVVIESLGPNAAMGEFCHDISGRQARADTLRGRGVPRRQTAAHAVRRDARDQTPDAKYTLPAGLCPL